MRALARLIALAREFQPKRGKNMAGSVNKVVLVGNLGRAPEIKTFANGGQVCNLSIATSETWKDKVTGEKKERTEWHRVTILNEGLVRVASAYLKQGSKVYIEGRLETRKYQDQSGADRYVTEVVLRPYSGELVLLGDPRGQGGDYGGGQYDRGGNAGSSGSGAGAGRSDLDDEIPF